MLACPSKVLTDVDPTCNNLPPLRSFFHKDKKGLFPLETIQSRSEWTIIRREIFYRNDDLWREGFYIGCVDSRCEIDKFVSNVTSLLLRRWLYRWWMIVGKNCKIHRELFRTNVLNSARTTKFTSARHEISIRTRS